jgi:hypothetical protein
MSPENTRRPFLAWLDRLDQRLVGLMSAHGIHLLRWAMSVVYLWFGGLKLIDASPAAELVVKTVFWLPPRQALLFIGGWCSSSYPTVRRDSAPRSRSGPAGIHDQG